MPANTPAWAQNLQLAYAYDPNSHGFSLFATNPGNVSLEVAVSQSNASGNGWTSGTFYGFMTDASKSPYVLRRDFYPNAAGQGGIGASSLTATVRRIGTSETITATFTPANTPYGTPVSVSTTGGTTTTTPTTPSNTNTTYGSPIGYLDYPNTSEAAGSPKPTALWGWAADRNQLNTPISLDFYVDGVKADTKLANGDRSSDVGPSIGDNGLHGYRWDIPAQYQNGTRQFAVYFAGSNIALTGSPKTIAYDTTTTTTSVPQPPTPPTVGEQTAAVGQAFSFTVPAFTSRQPLTYTASNLPAWLTFNPGTRVISGVPTTNIRYSIVITATDDLGKSSSTTIVIAVYEPTGQGTVIIRQANSSIMKLKTDWITLPSGESRVSVSKVSTTYQPGAPYHLYFYESGNLIGIDSFPVHDYPRGSRLLFHCKQASKEAVEPDTVVSYSAQTEIYIS